MRSEHAVICPKYRMFASRWELAKKQTAKAKQCVIAPPTYHIPKHMLYKNTNSRYFYVDEKRYGGLNTKGPGFCCVE